MLSSRGTSVWSLSLSFCSAIQILLTSSMERVSSSWMRVMVSRYLMFCSRALASCD